MGDGAAATRPGEFEARLREHRGILLKLAYAYGWGAEDREDLVQEICLQLWLSWPRYDSQRRFSTWMYRVALNTAISHARARRARGRSVPLDEALAVAARGFEPPSAAVEDLWAALQSLDELDRALVVLYLEGRSYREIGEVLGVSESNVGTKLNRLKKRLRRELVPREGGS
jgi:RNA polymerase sigma-70 factor (ECF subfamily)